ncbi:MAG: nucleotidyltransferase family protein [Bacteroidales bacterium]|nr:nucleotidyltransferase family protein [Bacteroidales bacterium]
MEGFILAAGLGTRLRPLTDDRPKALVEVGGMTLLERTLRTLESAGIEHIVVNVHHFADKVVDYLEHRKAEEERNRRACRIDISDERAMLLDTGGGLRHAAPLFSGRENVLIHNVDILSDVDLRDVERHHRESGNLVTLCVSRRQTRRMLAFDREGRLVGRAAADSPHQTTHCPLAFSGISVVSPELFALLPEADHPYPVIDEYIELSHAGYRIGAYEHAADRWLDVGKPETLEQARQWILSSAK